jgi:hemerythrin-like domain-containing protein
MQTEPVSLARGRAVARARAAVARAALGESFALVLDVPPRGVMRQLLDEGVLDRALVLLERDGDHGQVAILPRRASGTPSIAEVLEEDHRRLDDIAERMCQLAHMDPVQAVVLANLFASGMTRHVQAEEAILFPAYEARLGKRASTTALMEREHRAILHYVERLLRAAERVLDAKIRTEAVDDLLRAQRGLAAVLADHNDREERTLFPLLDHVLPEGERRRILHRLVLF